MQVEPTSPMIETARYGSVPALEATAVWKDQSGELVILCANRDRSTELELELELRGLGELSVIEHVALTGDDPYVRNTKDAPNNVGPKTLSAARVMNRRLLATIPPLSWNMVRLAR